MVNPHKNPTSKTDQKMRFKTPKIASVTKPHQAMVNPFPLVLIVEDDPKDAKIIREYLSNEPFRVEHVKTGESAVAFSKNEKIDLMVVDILLPGMDGFEVIENLKETLKSF